MHLGRRCSPTRPNFQHFYETTRQNCREGFSALRYWADASDCIRHRCSFDYFLLGTSNSHQCRSLANKSTLVPNNVPHPPFMKPSDRALAVMRRSLFFSPEPSEYEALPVKRKYAIESNSLEPRPVVWMLSVVSTSALNSECRQGVHTCNIVLTDCTLSVGGFVKTT